MNKVLHETVDANKGPLFENNGSFKNCSIKGSLANQKWFFIVIAVKRKPLRWHDEAFHLTSKIVDTKIDLVCC